MTRWHELVSGDASRRIWSTPAAVGPTQGVQLATMQKLIQYWGTDYDWSRCEAHLKSLPHFMTQIDGLDIHFIHVKSKHQNALPMIVTHGWPGSVIEQLKIIEPLTNPTAYGGTEADAFHLAIPSMPGYGFSGKPTETGWDPERIARAWIVLMKRLGYDRYVAQGGDWGVLITEQMAFIAPPELIAIHTNMPGIIPPEIVKALAAGGPPPADLGLDEERVYEQVADTLILVGLQRGPHKVLIEVVDSEGAVFTKQTVSFDAPGKRITYDELLRHAAF
jgi:pimeloyl-ACP methyl ester carboxylesterase